MHLPADPLVVASVAVAAVFVLVTGANDGGTLLGLGVRIPGMLPVHALLVLVAALMAGPWLFGLGVARAFTERLVATGSARGTVAFFAAVVGALLVVAVLTWRGRPTSLTLAVVGGLTGAGLGIGLPVSWHGVAVVLGIGAAAPVVGGVLGHGLGVLARRSPSFAAAPRAVRTAHLAAFVVQSLAYAANDGQKVYAVAAVARGVAEGGRTSGMALPLWLVAAVGAVFAVGLLASLRRLAAGIGRSLLPARPLHVVCAQLASSAAVLGSARLGVPVSMTQSVAAALVGTGASDGWRRVRWQQAVRVAVAWVVTLPLSVLAGAGLAVPFRLAMG